MTLSLENLRSTANKKHGTQTVLTYAQSFAFSLKESINHLVEWLTCHSIWYLLPENRVKLEELKFFQKKKKIIDIIYGQKTRNAIGNYNGKEPNFARNCISRRAQTD